MSRITAVGEAESEGWTLADAFLTAMDNVVIPRLAVALRSITGS